MKPYFINQYPIKFVPVYLQRMRGHCKARHGMASNLIDAVGLVVVGKGEKDHSLQQLSLSPLIEAAIRMHVRLTSGS